MSLLAIPSHINGAAVVRIASWAFGNQGITTLFLPHGLQEIGSYALKTNDIAAVEIPDTVTTIGESAFIENYNLSRIYLGKALQSIPANFAADAILARLIIPLSVQSVEAGALSSAPIDYIKIPSGVDISESAGTLGTNGAGFRTLYYSYNQAGGTYEFDGETWTTDAPEPIEPELDGVVTTETLWVNNYLTECGVFGAFKDPQTGDPVAGELTWQGSVFVNEENRNDEFSWQFAPDSPLYATIEGVSGIDSFSWVDCMTFVALSNEITAFDPTLKPATVVGSAQTVEIPWAIGGTAVYRIGDEAFRDKSLTAVAMGSHQLDHIGDYAFAENALSFIQLDPKVTPTLAHIGYKAFEGCGAGGTLAIPSSIVFVDQYAFASNALTSISSLGYLTEVLEGVFKGNNIGGGVSMPDWIDYESFAGNMIEEAFFEETVSYIDYTALSNQQTGSPVIFGYGGTEAEFFADSNGYTFVDLGGGGSCDSGSKP